MRNITKKRTSHLVFPLNFYCPSKCFSMWKCLVQYRALNIPGYIYSWMNQCSKSFSCIMPCCNHLKMAAYNSTPWNCSGTEETVLTPFKERKLLKCAKCYVSCFVSVFCLLPLIPNSIYTESCTCQFPSENLIYFLNFCFEKMSFVTLIFQ